MKVNVLTVLSIHFLFVRQMITIWFFFDMCRQRSPKYLSFVSKHLCLKSAIIWCVFVFKMFCKYYLIFTIISIICFKINANHSKGIHSYFLTVLSIDLITFWKIAPKLANFVSFKNQTIGSILQLFCTVEEGSFPVFFEWLKNSKSLNPSPGVNHKIENLRISSTLTIESITRSDQGNYTCVVKNPFGSDSQNIVLNIKGMFLDIWYPLDLILTSDWKQIFLKILKLIIEIIFIFNLDDIMLNWISVILSAFLVKSLSFESISETLSLILVQKVAKYLQIVCILWSNVYCQPLLVFISFSVIVS